VTFPNPSLTTKRLGPGKSKNPGLSMVPTFRYISMGTVTFSEMNGNLKCDLRTKCYELFVVIVEIQEEW